MNTIELVAIGFIGLMVVLGLLWDVIMDDSDFPSEDNDIE